LFNSASQNGEVYSASSIPALWDEAVALVLEALLDGLASIKGCTPEGRAGMSLDVACLVNGLKDTARFLGPSSLKMKIKLEDFVKSYYYDSEEVENSPPPFFFLVRGVDIYVNANVLVALGFAEMGKG